MNIAILIIYILLINTVEKVILTCIYGKNLNSRTSEINGNFNS